MAAAPLLPLIGALSGAAGAATGVYGVMQNRKAGQAADAARQNAEATASRNANAKLVMQRQAMRDNNLLAGPEGPKSTLGVG